VGGNSSVLSGSSRWVADPVKVQDFDGGSSTVPHTYRQAGFGRCDLAVDVASHDIECTRAGFRRQSYR
jgi:hypothetical protein